MPGKIHHLDCCTLCPRAGRWLVGGDEMCIHVLAIETARDGIVLVDTGFSVADCRDPARLPAAFRFIARPRLEEARTALGQLRALGFTASDVRHVVVTHLDLDHAGGLPDFPDATVHLHRPEHGGAMRPRRCSK